MSQLAMLSSPSKHTNEIDWTEPLKAYIRANYGDDPEQYAGECSSLQRLRQDMRGASRESVAGRDLLYRYYGQLELLDLRFPVDESHIKISFTWFDAFTQEPTSQYSLAFEKASIIFNIAAALSCCAVSQDLTTDAGQKAAYHSFQASAGMFTYINENFLHAPSKDLSRETVKTLVGIMLAQAQEVFVGKQVRDKRKASLIAKISSQAASLYAQLIDGIQENITRGIFDTSWLGLIRIKSHYLSGQAQFYQSLADEESGDHGTSISRLQIACRETSEAYQLATSMTQTSPSNAVSAESRGQLLVSLSKHSTSISEKLNILNKDNDFIYHQVIPAEATLPAISKLAAAKAIPVGELYQVEDIQRIIGPDIFQRIIPIAVTESASLYDEEKAKLVRAETEKVELAEGEMMASLDYLKLPNSLDSLKGSMNQEHLADSQLYRWCNEIASKDSCVISMSSLNDERDRLSTKIKQCSRLLDQEEITCEKMRSKYGSSWEQQPSLHLSTALRNDHDRFRSAIVEAHPSDTRLANMFQQYSDEISQMRCAGETHQIEALFQKAMVESAASVPQSSAFNLSVSLLDEDFSDSVASVADQIAGVDDLLHRLTLVSRDRAQVLKDLKELAQHDDISSVLILNKKSLGDQEQQLFQTELDKFRPYQTRLLQSTHKQTSLMKDLTKKFGTLLQDKRIKSELLKHESFQRQRVAVKLRYQKAFGAYKDLIAGLSKARQFYKDMSYNVDNLETNVASFVSNRRAEGAHLLGRIEQRQNASTNYQATHEKDQLTALIRRISEDLSVDSPSYLRAPETAKAGPGSVDILDSQNTYTGQSSMDEQLRSPPHHMIAHYRPMATANSAAVKPSTSPSFVSEYNTGSGTSGGGISTASSNLIHRDFKEDSLNSLRGWK